MNKILSLALVLSMSLSLLAACSIEKSSEEAAPAAPEKIAFTYVVSPLNVPSIIERDQGVFAKHLEPLGATVEYSEITSGADQTQALASGDIQVLYAVGGTSVILSAANGADIKILNMYSRSPAAFSMFSKDESLTTPESLAGKTIAGPAGTNLHELLVAYLATADMTLADVNYVSMGIPDAKAGLDGGSVDVALIAGPTAYMAEQQGYHKVTDGEGLISAIIAVCVTQEFYDAYPEVITALGAAQEEIVAYINDQQDAALATVAETLDLEVSAVEDMYGMYDFSLTTTQSDLDGFQQTADFMFENGMIENSFDVSTLFIQQ